MTIIKKGNCFFTGHPFTIRKSQPDIYYKVYSLSFRIIKIHNYGLLN